MKAWRRGGGRHVPSTQMELSCHWAFHLLHTTPPTHLAGPAPPGPPRSAPTLPPHAPPTRTPHAPSSLFFSPPPHQVARTNRDSQAEKDARVEYLSWRVWAMKRKRAALAARAAAAARRAAAAAASGSGGGADEADDVMSEGRTALLYLDDLDTTVTLEVREGGGWWEMRVRVYVRVLLCGASTPHNSTSSPCWLALVPAFLLQLHASCMMAGHVSSFATPQPLEEEADAVEEEAGGSREGEDQEEDDDNDNDQEEEEAEAAGGGGGGGGRRSRLAQVAARLAEPLSADQATVPDTEQPDEQVGVKEIARGKPTN